MSLRVSSEDPGNFGRVHRVMIYVRCARVACAAADPGVSIRRVDGGNHGLWNDRN